MQKRVFLMAIVLAVLASSAHSAQEGAAAGVCLTKKGSIIRQEKPEAKWQFVDKGEALKAGELLVGLPGASLESRDKAVKMTFLTDFGDSPFPVIECAVKLHETKGFSLDVTLERGRADFTNTQAKGAAAVHVRVHDQVFDLTLQEPKTRVALELYGRWLPGVPFKLEPAVGEGPTANLVVLVLEGSVTLKHDGKVFEMSAPPGPALIQWDSKGGLDAKPGQLPKLPPWALPDRDNNPRVQVFKKLFGRYYELAQTKTLDEILQDFIASDDEDFRRAFVTVCAATDQFQLVAPVLRDPKYAELWDHAIRVLRHWIGRDAGQDQKLYKLLIGTKLYKPVDAESALQLLHSFSKADLGQPATYEALIDYLEDERVLMRALANWHLVRLVPEGREFKYNPNGDKQERAEAVKKWRKLIPAGKLPPSRDK